MSDPLSITASLVGVTTAAIQSVAILSQTIGNIKNAPDTVKTVKADLLFIEPILNDLNASLQHNRASQLPITDLIPALENCSRTCTAFRERLDHWMRHSTEDRTFWMDRWRVGLFGLERVKMFRGQLNDCKSTLSVALATANVLAPTRQGFMMQDMKDMMLQQTEVMLRNEIARADTELPIVGNSLARLSVEGSTMQTTEVEQGRDE